jgi:hypothetical protein
MVTFLVKNKANIKCVDILGRTVLHAAARRFNYTRAIAEVRLEKTNVKELDKNAGTSLNGLKIHLVNRQIVFLVLRVREHNQLDHRQWSGCVCSRQK